MENKSEILQKIYLTNHEVKEQFLFNQQDTLNSNSEVFSVRFYCSFVTLLNNLSYELGVSKNQLIVAAVYRFLEQELLLSKFNHKT